MSLTHLISESASLPEAWRSKVVGQPAGCNLKIVRMDDTPYETEVHDFDEALLVLEGRMNLEVNGRAVPVEGGSVYVVPAGVPHCVAAGSRGTLVIIDAI